MKKQIQNSGSSSNGQASQQPNLLHRAPIVSPIYIKDTLEQENYKLKHQIGLLEVSQYLMIINSIGSAWEDEESIAF